jgi:hypothetical protein
MNTYESLETLYTTLEKIFGPDKAKTSTSKILFIVIDEIQQEGLPLTDSNLEERISKFINDFEEVSKHQVA